MHEFEDLLTLSEAAKVAPGRPSANCLWRWCRRGVLSRGGERVYLRHVRVGGKVCTRKQWIEEFGQSLAAADAAYFQQDEDDGVAPSRPKRRRQRFEQHRRESIQAAHRDLEDAGL